MPYQEIRELEAIMALFLLFFWEVLMMFAIFETAFPEVVKHYSK